MAWASSTSFVDRLHWGTLGEFSRKPLSPSCILTTNSYKYIYIFVAWDCIEALCWYLFGWVVATMWSACLPLTYAVSRLKDAP
jgi:hypothetical protein